ncbi:MAG: hypothetical protein ACI4T1_03410 [Christensenellales bacterium]
MDREIKERVDGMVKEELEMLREELVRVNAKEPNDVYVETIEYVNERLEKIKKKSLANGPVLTKTE